MKQQEKKTKEKEQRREKTQANRKYKDTIFRMLFRDKKNLLQLYNAVSGNRCGEPNVLKVVTLENTVYMGIKNDVAFLIDLDLHLYEHQSTINFNMPFRFLQYVAEEYEKLTAEENIYRSRIIPLPAPHFVVFYNGVDSFPEKETIRLSDAFPSRDEIPQLELIVQILNINEGYNTKLKSNCRPLKEYMQYVNKIREYTVNMPLDEAVDRAVDECIKEGVLKDFLLKNKAEVKHMSIYEYDEETYRRAIRIEEYERGMEQGIKALVEMGLDIGLSENDILEKLQTKLNISLQKAQEYFAAFKEHITARHDVVREGVKEVMVGRVLEYEAKTILRRGIEQGISQGISQGIEQEKTEIILDFLGELGEIPMELENRIKCQKNPETLRLWCKAAARAQSLQEFEERIASL